MLPVGMSANLSDRDLRLSNRQGAVPIHVREALPAQHHSDLHRASIVDCCSAQLSQPEERPSSAGDDLSISLDPKPSAELVAHHGQGMSFKFRIPLCRKETHRCTW